MKKSAIWMLAVVMFVTFFALLFLQVRYMRVNIINRTQQFEEQARRSLHNVVRALELDQTREFMEMYGQTRISPRQGERINSDRREMRPEQQRGGQPFGRERTISNIQLERQQTLSMRYRHEMGLLWEVANEIVQRASNKSIEERIDFSNLYLHIQRELVSSGLGNIPFSFQVVNFSNQAVYTSPGFSTRYRSALYTTPLFPNDPPERLNSLRVFFPTKQEYIRSELTFFIPAIIFTLILLVTFLFTVITLFRQKRLSEMKNDFINNMTHELKTPVSTISLASQMLKDNTILKSPETFKHVTGVISDETKRLSFQVEKVLQMSLFDRQKSTLKLKELDANDLVVSVANTYVLKVEKYGGTLDIDLQAEESAIKVDEMHFTNVLFNLLDNAVKYRKEDVPLELMIRTRNESNRLIISVEDNGIGIRKEDAKKIFDRFYRVHTGNRHDVKGFGLGLAYVKKIVTDLNGTIRAEGEIGKGTKFIINLPTLIQK